MVDGRSVKSTVCPEDLVQFSQAHYDGLLSSKTKYYSTCAHDGYFSKVVTAQLALNIVHRVMKMYSTSF